MPRLFGTDGVRGLANRELTADLALGLAQAAAAVLTQGRHADELRAAGRRPVAVVARDPRVSGEFLTAAVSAGLASSGVDVLDAGVIPTPATAFLIDSIRADFGVMISASHNPMPDNGIKIFGPGGHKLDDAAEDRIEDLVAAGSLSQAGAHLLRDRWERRHELAQRRAQLLEDGGHRGRRRVGTEPCGLLRDEMPDVALV